MSVTFESIRFGQVEIPEDDVIEFPSGLIGLGGLRYALIDRNPGTGFLWLHALDDPAPECSNGGHDRRCSGAGRVLSAAGKGDSKYEDVGQSQGSKNDQPGYQIVHDRLRESGGIAIQSSNKLVTHL